MKKTKTIILRIDEEMYNEILMVKRDDENLSETVRRLIGQGFYYTPYADALAKYWKWKEQQ